MDRVLILDNGAHSIKALHLTKGARAKCVLFSARRSLAHSDDRSVSRNAVCASKVAKRNYIGSQLELCPDYSNLFFRLPFEKVSTPSPPSPLTQYSFSTAQGILNNWETQKTVWDHLFSEDALYVRRSNRSSPLRFRSSGPRQIDTASTQLLVTEPVCNLPNVQDAYDQIIFEEYNFASCLRAPGPALVPYGQASTSAVPLAKRSPECVLVVDAGYSFTHVVPVLRGAIITSGVRRFVKHLSTPTPQMTGPLTHCHDRIDVGGKLLTNHLKELISFRQLYMMDQTSVSEKAKQDCCYVTMDWNQDIEIAKWVTLLKSRLLPLN